MTFENLEKKFRKEYDEAGFFPFLARHMNGEGKNLKKVITKNYELKCFEYVSSHPDTDLEKFYLKELLFIQVQNEIDTFLGQTEELHEKITDEEGKIIIGSGEYENADVFKANIEEDTCIDKGKFSVDDYDLVIGNLTGISLSNIGNASMKSFILILE